MTQHTVTRWISDWRHALIALGFGVLALCAAVFVPETRWEKLGLLVERIAEDPAGAAVIVSLLAGAVTTLRGAWMRTPPPAALLLVAFMLPALTGCGAGALRQHATIATVASAALASGAPLVAPACDAALTACHGADACITPTVERCRVAAASVEVAVASVRGYADAIEVAALADEGETMPALLAALGGVTRLWAALVAALTALGVQLPALPAIASAMLGGGA